MVRFIHRYKVFYFYEAIQMTKRFMYFLASIPLVLFDIRPSYDVAMVHCYPVRIELNSPDLLL